jgi:polar amino acid transport system ATP-binding protein
MSFANLPIPEAPAMTSQPADPAFIEMVEATKRYGSQVVLSEVTFSVSRGEVVFLIGPSGSGKTTLLRCMGLLVPLDSGYLRLEGRLHGYEKEGDRIVCSRERRLVAQRLQSGFVFQDFNLFPHKTALENIILAPRRVLRHKQGDVEREGRALLARVGLSSKEDSYPAELSGGQQQRVAIARALAMQPKVMLFDEPTSALDPEMVAEVRQVIIELAREGMTMVVVSHEMGLVRSAADRIVFMENGAIIDEGTPEHFFSGSVGPRVQEFLAKIL